MHGQSHLPSQHQREDTYEILLTTQTGIRYLENAILKLDYSQLRLVYEALKERATLLRLAPHLAGKSDSEYNFSPVPLLLLLLLPFLPFLP